jgi:protein-disulfide isomerase
MKRALPFVIIIGVLGATLFTTWYLRRSAIEPQRPVPPDTSLPKSRASTIKLGADPAHTIGATDAPVMLEEFGDFECQPCGLLHPTLKTMKAEFGPSVVIVFREFPLVAKHPHALEAAQAAEAAGLQGKFWEMHDLLYENQKTWHDASDVQPIFAEYATRIGLILDRFKQDLSSEIASRRIVLDRERGYSIGVNSTPTVFLNGREVPLESMSADKLRTLINGQIRPEGSK